MLRIFIGFLFGFGLFLVLLDVFKIPYYKTSRAAINLSKMQQGRVSVLESGLEDIAIWLSKHIRLNPYKRTIIESDLSTANLSISPEMHKANSIVKAAVIAFFAIPVGFFSPIFSLIIIVLSIYQYKKAINLEGKIHEKRQRIEYELPRFVFTIEKSIKHSRNVLSMLETYSENAGKDLKHELDITTADMRSGNYEAAITRLESRVGSSMMSDVCRGLISIIRGDDTELYWTALSLKFGDAQRQRLKMEALKIPPKVQRLSLFLFICFLLIYIVVIVAAVIEALGVLFV